MASTIVTKNSSTASAVPLTGDLTQGELAVNVTDKRLFTKNSGGTVVELGINPSSLTMSGGTANGVAYLNGSKVVTTGSALTFDGTNLGVTGSTNGLLTTTVTNSNTGTSARADIIVASDSADIRMIASSGSYNGVSGWADTGIISTSSGTSGGMLFNVQLASPVYRFMHLATNELMRLTSTGLGIGTSSPGYKLDVGGAANAVGAAISTTYGTSAEVYSSFRFNNTGQSYGNSEIRNIVNGSVSTGSNLAFFTSAGGTGTLTERMRLDTSGNLGLGVTPSAWNTYTALQVKTAALWSGNSLNSFASLTGNVYYQGGYKYIASDYATEYYQYQGAHVWRTAASGTAGNAITFTQAMTLDASGNLGVGTTSPSRKFHVVGSGVFSDGTNDVTLWNDGSVGTNANIALKFNTNGTERARIDSSGNLLVGDTALVANERLYVRATASTGYAIRFYNTQATAGSTYGQYILYTASTPNGTGNEFIRCDDATASRFSVRSNGGIANYSANNVNLSDRREKTNFAPAGEYLSKICAIPVQTFNYIDQNLEEDDGLTLGVVAQDVQAIAPELVTESNWGTEENPKMRLSIYQTDLQYALMKCIQEQQALITQLTERITALEGK